MAEQERAAPLTPADDEEEASELERVLRRAGTRPDAQAEVPAAVLRLRGAPTPAQAEAALAALDAQPPTGTFDAQAGQARMALVGLLLRAGYPWALRLKPEDLALYRDLQEAPRRRRLVGAAVAAGVTALASGGWLIWQFFL